MILQADARHIPLADESVNCVVTSPPYFGLRDYGTAKWEGGNNGCDHLAPKAGGTGPASVVQVNVKRVSFESGGQYKNVCCKCGATRIDKQIGLEPTPELYVQHIVEVFREVWRVLRGDGTVWINLGDSYARNGGEPGGGNRELLHMEGKQRRMMKIPDGNLKPKDLIGIPWRVAFALQADGWYLRSDIIWSKPNPMPESVTDRPTKSHEYIFLLSKRERYYFDQDAVREPQRQASFERARLSPLRPVRYDRKVDKTNKGLPTGTLNPAGRNIRSVWTVATQPFPEAHFATFPEDLIKPCILAGCPVGGIVLDPFGGSCTTVKVAQDLGRRGIALDLKPEYLEMGKRRSAQIGLKL